VDTELSLTEKLRLELRAICEIVEVYFAQVYATLEKSHGYTRYSSVLTEEDKIAAQKLRQRLTAFGTQLLAAAKSSAVLEQTDEAAIRRLLRKMSAAISLKSEMVGGRAPSASGVLFWLSLTSINWGSAGGPL